MQVKSKFELPWIEKYRPETLDDIIDHKEKINTLKNEIKALCKTPEMTASSDLVAELDKKIRTAKRHYR